MSDTDEPMGRFAVPDREELPEDIRERIDEETERAGFTPNVFRAMAYRPEHFRAFFAYQGSRLRRSPSRGRKRPRYPTRSSKPRNWNARS